MNPQNESQKLIRCVSPDLKDVIIQSLATFVCHKDSLRAVENMPVQM